MENQPQLELSRNKKIVFSLIMVIIMWLILEGGIALTYRIVRGKAFPRAGYVQMIQTISQGAVADPATENGPNSGRADAFEPFASKTYVIHPYLGYYSNLTGVAAEEPFLGYSADMLTRRDDKLIVGIFGGSFAGGVYSDAGQVLVERLNATTGKEIVLIPLPVAGYKQPQQLMELAYLLSLGAEFDVVINIDGFNEAALGPAENLPKGVFPGYPRSWYFLTGQISDPEQLAKISQLDALKQQRDGWARFFAKSRLTFSNVFLILWRAGDVWLTREWVSISQELAAVYTQAQGDFLVTGPEVVFADDQALFESLATIWQNSSVQMDALCEAYGIEYYHFLQPNQYVAGSKPMGEAEIALAINLQHPYGQNATKGYPYIIEFGKPLFDMGVNFHDLTQVFADTSDPMYKDDCCHLNPTGYQIVAEKIVELMLADGFGQE